VKLGKFSTVVFTHSPQMASLWTCVMKLGNVQYVPLVLSCWKMLE